MLAHNNSITIIGAGPAGLSAAAALSALDIPCRVIEKQPREAIASPADDGREIALTWRSVDLLKRIGAWNFIDESAQGKICAAHVLNRKPSQSLVFSAATTACDRLAFVVSNYLIRRALFQAIEHNPLITCHFGEGVSDIQTTPCNATITLETGQSFTSRLAVAADSRFSKVRDLMGIAAETLDFKRTMIVSRMRHDTEHLNRAYEWFQGDYTLAMLPLAGNHSSAVLTLPQGMANEHMAMDKEAYCQHINQLFQHQYGALTMEGQRHAYPLVARYAKSFYAPSFLLIGDAAVGMHPVTAHGFNFGLRSIDILTQLITQNQSIGYDWAEAGILRRYHQELRLITRPLYLMTNAIAGLYTKTDMLSLVIRSGLIKAGNHLPLAKRLLTQKLLDRVA